MAGPLTGAAWPDDGRSRIQGLVMGCAWRRFQIVSVAHHSLGAIEGIKAGVFRPPSGAPPTDYAGLQKIVADADTALKATTPDEINALGGKDVTFHLGEM